MIKKITTFTTITTTSLLIVTLLLLLITVNADSSSDYALSSVSLLLPYSTNKFRKPIKLESNKGCFEWTTSNPDLIEIIPQYDTISCGVDGDGQPTTQLSDLSAWEQSLSDQNQQKCSKSINILVRNPGSLTNAERNSAFIYAEEKMTNRILQCEVFVDKISSIVIETTTKTMYKDDVEELHVRAYDSVGNVFSSIVGLEFEWSIQSGNVIQIVPFRGFLRDELALKMEQEGLQTSFVLVQGVDTGRTQIHTKLTDQYYKDIHHSTTISILEPLQLNPNYLLYVIPGTQIQYQLLTKKRNTLENIQLPNPNYLWSSSNSKVGMVDNSGLFMAMDLGKTELKVQHANMSDNRVQSLVNVVQASYLQIKIEPLSKNLGPGPVVNWNLIQTRNYIVILELFDASGHKIYNPDIAFDIQIPQEYFEPLPNSEIPPAREKRSDSYYLKAIKQGTTSIKAALLRVYDIQRKQMVELLNPITVEQPVNIHPEIFLTPPIVYLPFIPKFKQQYPLKATGGSGEYSFLSNHTSIVTVDQSGLITSNFQPGQTEIVVVDRKNPHNRQSMIVFLLEPNEIQIVPLPSSQVELGKQVELYLKLKSSQIPRELDGSFDKYQLPALPWKMDDEKIFKAVPEQPNHFLSLREGSSLVQVEFLGMKSSLRLFAFQHLKVQPDYILLTLGSSKVVTFTGGPEPWYLDPKVYTQQVQLGEGLTKQQVSLSPLQSNSFTVQCLQHSSGTIQLSVGNKPSSTNQNPIIQTIDIPYGCQLPKSIQIVQKDSSSSSAEKQLNDCVTSTAGDIIGDTIRLRNRRTVDFDLLALDEQGRVYNNHSTLLYDWSISDESKASLSPSKSDSSASLKLYDQEGKLTLKAQLNGYKTSQLQSQRISIPKTTGHTLKSQLDLYLISTVKLEPESKLLYLSDQNLLKMQAIGGSKNFKFSLNNSKLATIIPNNDARDQILLRPLQSGYVRVQVDDLCQGIQGEQVSSSHFGSVQISEVHSIQIQVPNMVQVGNSIDLTIRAYSMSGDEFDASQYQYMSSAIRIDNPTILSMQPSLDSSQLYHLKGLDQGLVSLLVQITNPITNNTVLSKTVLIQVYPPFKLSLRTLHLMPNGLYQIHWSGGSTSQEVEFQSHDNSIVTFQGTSNRGELKALKVGETKVTSRAYIIDNINGQRLLIGEDQLIVYVKNMNGIRIHCSIDKVLVGNEAKLRVVGDNGETPFTYGTVDLYFKWESLDSNVASLAPIYQQFNSSVELEGSFTIRVLGINPGQTTITVWAYQNAQISQDSPSNYIFQSKSFQIQVLPVIPIPTSTLLLPLNAISNHPYSQVPNVRYQTLDQYSSCQGIVQIQHQPQPKLSTLDKVGTCLLSVQRDSHMDTSKLLMVNVKPFSHLEVLPLPINKMSNSRRLGGQSMVISIQDQMSFISYLRDDLGELFTEYANVANLVIEPSNTGIVGITTDVSNSNFTILHVKGIRPGQVTLHIYLKDQPHLDDYIKVFVGKLIEPYSPVLHVGSTVEFDYIRDQKSSGTNKQLSSSSDRWETSDPSLLSINGQNGKSKALKEGQTFVNYIQSPTSSTPVVISKIHSIQLVNAESGAATININQVDKEFKYYLRFLNQDDMEFTQHASIDQSIQGQCSIRTNSKFAHTKFEYDSNTGEYYCVVIPTGQDSYNLEKLQLTVQVYNKEKSYSLEKSFPLHIETSLSILNVPTSTIRLSQHQREFKLVIQSQSQVFVETDSKLLSIQPFVDTDTQTHHGRYKFLIQPMKPTDYFQDETITVSVLDAVSQQKKTQILFVSNHAESSGNSFSFYFVLFFMLLVIVGGLYITIPQLTGPKTKQEKSSFPTNQSLFSQTYNPSTYNNNNNNMNSPVNSRFQESYPTAFRTPPQARSTIHLRESIYKSPGQY
ncbi:nucleoporin [Tieghemostelium lacteum]|uniref:Nucleoporin n=1 Tax=Tieghemostelium lacteum TaxID=361077 RepID=A0A152A9H1_TIELA|nr:nucleoporin [Tieghemostelium lacteum]|eukprot:KYR02872.1 nucleoporin [Tieghemostelium lacteum]